ncbi:MAG: tetratricopeptide repeat protein [Bacteroidales bacterium]|nr:tetratricopeptide repeat protein [Bacteroidales bacterium]
MYLRKKKFIFFVFVTVLIVSCSTKKNTFITRTYHNLVSHYNIYFNGKEAYKQGLQKIETSFEEPYNTILPLFYYKDKSVLSSASSDMDRAIQKCSKLIKQHSLTARPNQKGTPTTPKQKAFYAKKEYNEWVKQAYLLMGNAFFYKEEYREAQKNYQFLLVEYSNNEIRFNAYLGIARVRVEQNQYEQARDILQKMSEDAQFPEELFGELYALYTDINIQQKKYDEAIVTLEKTLEYNIKKKEKVRYTYILAQLYQEIGYSDRAIALYSEVEKMNPTYEMTFQARINKATAYGGGGGSSQIITQLNKLLKDEKNKEYRDQIYYALANIYYQENKEDKAFENYKLSLQFSQSESYQKAMSYLAIGDILLSKRQYIKAAPYYDSCSMILPQDYRNYSEVMATNENLKALANEHSVVVTQDSLLRIANMSKPERNAFVDKIIADINQREREAREREAIQREQSRMYAQEFGSQNQKLGGAWYFYNDAVVQLGKTEFVTKWGDRKLRDNWRFSQMNQNDWDVQNDENPQSDSLATETEGNFNIKSRDFYLKDLPLTDSAQKAAVRKVEVSMFQKGMIYYNSIQDNEKAVSTLESFVSRFPNSEYAPIAYYYLHIISLELNNFSLAEEYKQKLISEFPESNYSSALTDPEYLNNIRTQIKQAHADYSKLYKAFVVNNTDEVIRISQSIQYSYPQSDLLPKAVFLENLSRGKRDGADKLKQYMTSYAEMYPDSELYDMALRIAHYIDTVRVQTETGNEVGAEQILQSADSESYAQEKQQDERKEFVYNEDAEHFLCIIVRSEFVNANRIRFNLLNYNLDYFTNFNFDISVRELSLHHNMVILERFDEVSQAINYYELITYSDEVFEGVEKSFTYQCVINQHNLDILMQYKNLDEYLSFFQENYIQ